jgi:glutaredoxin
VTVTLYSTGCPKCAVLKKKLEEKGVSFSEFTDVDRMMEMDIQSVPMLYAEGELMDFAEAIGWINQYAASDADKLDEYGEECELCKLS